VRTTRLIAIATTLAICLGCQAPVPSEDVPTSGSGQSEAAPIEEARAIQIARDFVLNRYGDSPPLFDITNPKPELVGSNWEVKVDAKVVPVPSQPPIGVHWIIQVDSAGHASILAQG